MRNNIVLAGFVLSSILFLGGCDRQEDSAVLRGPYLGQKPPGTTPEVFAPGVVSTSLDELNSVFTPDGQEFYFCVRNMAASSLFVMRSVRGAWGPPEFLPFAGPYNDIDVSLSPDGQRLFFCSNRPIGGGDAPKQDYDIWMCPREGDSWGPPEHLGDAVNSARDDFYPVVTNSGSLYFNSQRAGPGTNDVYVCRWEDGKFAPAEKLGPEINTEYREFDAFVAPAEDFMIVTSQRPDDDPFGDLYISFKDPEGNWTPARNMGEAINRRGAEFGTVLSPDGKFLFFTRQAVSQAVKRPDGPLTYDDYVKMKTGFDNGSSNIWWVDAKIIEGLRPARNP